MAPQKTVTARSQQRRTPAHDKSLEPDNNDAESNDDPMDKDAAEEELEKLVFGDDAGFREGLRAHTQQGPTFGGVERHGSEDEEHQESAGEDDLEAADDADVCPQYIKLVFATDCKFYAALLPRLRTNSS